MSKHNELLCQIERFAATGDPYFQRVAETVAPVKMHTLRGASFLSIAMSAHLPGFKVEPKKCYDNSSILALVLEDFGVKYVEGFVISGSRIDSHAWISHDGRYYDPTYEQVAKQFKKYGNWRKEYSYAKVIEMSATDLWATCCPGGRSKEYHIPGPATVGMWGFSDDAQEFYALKGVEAGSVIAMLKDDRFREMVIQTSSLVTTPPSAG